MRVFRDLGRVALADSVNRDIPNLKVAIGVRTFKHFGIPSRDRDILDSIHEIGGYTSREDIS